jgi:hypothetical protein
MLKVKSPWRIKEIKIYDKNKVVDVYIQQFGKKLSGHRTDVQAPRV